MVFQNYAPYPHRSVRENLAFPLRAIQTPKVQVASRVDSVAGSLGLTPLLNRKPKDLSGGQQQRVATGRAIIRQPSVFLFDEPLSNLDAKLRVEMRTE
jgi:multiple sugar transport system ATP-binding protein